MFILFDCLVVYSTVAAHMDDGAVPDGVWPEMPPAVVVLRDVPEDDFTHPHRRNLQSQQQKSTANFFDLNPRCEQLGSRYCDYGPHNLGSGLEFASWAERTQFMYTNMVRQDYTVFQKAPYNANYACTPATKTPFFWSSELTQASRFHSDELMSFGIFQHETATQNADLFGGSTDTFKRVRTFAVSIPNLGVAENVAGGSGTPWDTTKQWLASQGHCQTIFSDMNFMGVGYAAGGKHGHYWTQNFLVASENYYPIGQPIVAGTHDKLTSHTVRFFAHIATWTEAPSNVVVVVGGTTKTMTMLFGINTLGVYFVDVAIDSLPAHTDGCVSYHFEVNSGYSRMPYDTSYSFLTYGINGCTRNIGLAGICYGRNILSRDAIVA